MKPNVRNARTWPAAISIAVTIVVAASLSLSGCNSATQQQSVNARKEAPSDQRRQNEAEVIEPKIIDSAPSPSEPEPTSAAAIDQRRPVEPLVSDSNLTKRLKDIRSQQSQFLIRGDFDGDAIDRAYAAAFELIGIDLASQTLEQAAERVRARPEIAEALTAALDDWAFWRRRLNDSEGEAQLIKIARDADPDPWRRQLRDALANRDALRLRDLAVSDEVRKLQLATLVLFGEGLRTAGEVERSVDVLRIAREEYPDDFWINQSLAAALRNVDPVPWEEVVACYRRVVELQPDYARAHDELGIALQETGQHEKAIASLLRAIELAPERPAPHLRLGIAFQKSGLLSDALTSFRKVLELEPENGLAYYHIGNVIRERGDLNGAIRSYAQAVELDPGLTEAQLQLAIALEERGAVEEAVPHYRRVMELDPENRAALTRLTAALEENGKPEELVALYTKIVELEPDNVTAKIKKARSLALAHKYVEAQKALDKLAKTDLQANAKDARETLDLLVNWTGGEHKWEDTERYLETLVYGSPTGGYLEEGFLHNTMFELMYAPLLIELGDTTRYEALRDSALARHGSTRNTMFAERMLLVSMLRPADELQMEVADNLASVTGRTLDRRIEQLSQLAPGQFDPHMYRWACTVLALYEYRRANYEKSLDWGQKCLSLGPFPAVTERVRVVMAMDYAKLKQLDKAKEQLAQCQKHIEEMRQGILDAKVYEAAGYLHGVESTDVIYREKGFWHDWIINRILLREALALLEEQRDATTDVAAAAGDDTEEERQND